MNAKPEIKYFKSFVVYTLVALFGGAVVGAIQGAILGGILAATGSDLSTIQMVSGISGFLFGTIISFFVYRWVIRTQIIPQVAKYYEINNP
ncbi:MAG: hypothetical protein JJU05_19100 [Verrucomicrobia bacterium]|nr:hypothetical protein [Verrucomicrobiota bacterium]MCH8528924.1 hypothetical protein [Kiritimatiellia bacterium]